MNSRGLWLLLLLSALVPATSRAQEELGGQRRGTTSFEFLKIGVGARAEGMGEAFVSVANDASAMYWNPAGIGSILRREVQVNTVSYPADIRYNYIAAVFPAAKLGGSLGIQIGGLNTDMAETDEFHPFGTGRTFTFSDFVLGATYARRFTDKLLLGFGVKYAREDFGSQIDAPVSGAILFDLGSIYYLGYKSLRVGMSLTSFGSEVGPGGDFVSVNDGSTRSYDKFSAPTMFRYGLGFEPLERQNLRITTALEAVQASDNALEFRGGGEALISNHLSLRGGYQFKRSQVVSSTTDAAGNVTDVTERDVFGLTAGAGFRGKLGSLNGQVDYSYTDAGALGHVDRVSLQVVF